MATTQPNPYYNGPNQAGAFYPTAPNLGNPAAGVNPTPPTPQPAAGVVNQTTKAAPVAGTTTNDLPQQGAPANYYSGNNQQSTAQNAATTQSAQAAAPGSTQLKPWETGQGFNGSYTPKDQNELTISQTSPYLDASQKALISANFAKSQGVNIDTSGMATNDIAAAKQKADSMNADKSALDKQIEFQEQQTKDQANATMSGVQSSLAQSREGVTSTGNSMASGQITGNIQATTNQQLSQLANTKRQQDEAMKSGQSELAKSLGQSIANQQQAISTFQQQQQTNALNLVDKLSAGGALDSVSINSIAQQYGVDPSVIKAYSAAQTKQSLNQQQQKQFENQTKAIDTVKGIVASGVPITLSQAQQFSQETGLPVDSILSFNQTAQQIMGDKGLDDQQKQQAIQEKGYQLNQQSQGIFTAAAQNTSYLTHLYNTNADPQTIAAFKQAAGIQDQNDPMYQAKLQYQMAQTDQERQNAYINAVNNGINPGAIIPQGGNYSMTISQNGKVNLEPPDGTKAGQCGHYVNQVFGSKTMPDSYAGKLKVCDPNVGFGEGQTSPQPGMAFVMPISQSNYGHTGIFLGVDPNKPGMAQVKDSNWHNNETVATHDIPLSQITGYASPPSAVQSGGNPDNMSPQSILKNADAQGMKFKNIQEQNQYISMVKQQGFLPGQSQNNNNTPAVKPDYKQYGLLASTDFNPGNATDKAAAMYLDSYIKNGAYPTVKSLGIGTGKDSSGKFSDAAARANDLFFAATGQSLPDVKILNSNKDLIAANNKILNTMGIQGNTVTANFKLAIDNMDKNGLNQNSQPINEFFNKMAELGGNPATSGYLAQTATLGTELSKLLASGAGTTGAVTVGDKLEAAGLINKNASEDQQKEVLKKLLAEAANAEQSIRSASGDLYKQVDPLERLSENPNRKSTQPQNSKQSGGALSGLASGIFNSLINAGKGTALVHDAHAQTGKYAIPEDHSINKYKF